MTYHNNISAATIIRSTRVMLPLLRMAKQHFVLDNDEITIVDQTLVAMFIFFTTDQEIIQLSIDL